jgi:hypothetical protein
MTNMLTKIRVGEFHKQQFVKSHVQGKIESPCFIRYIYNQYFHGFSMDFFSFILLLRVALSIVFINRFQLISMHIWKNPKGTLKYSIMCYRIFIFLLRLLE